MWSNWSLEGAIDISQCECKLALSEPGNTADVEITVTCPAATSAINNEDIGIVGITAQVEVGATPNEDGSPCPQTVGVLVDHVV